MLVDKSDQLFKPLIQSGKLIGLAVGIVEQGEFHLHYYGSTGIETNQKISEDSLFEIGSITKVFTTLLTVKILDEYSIDIENFIHPYLPKVPAGEKHYPNITFKELLTHTSGLSNNPESIIKFNKVGIGPLRISLPVTLSNNAIANRACEIFEKYDAEMIYQKLLTIKLKNKSFSYSNFGMGLLGHLLELITGQPYNQLLLQYILKPLKMESTYIAHKQLNPPATIQGYSRKKKPRPPFVAQSLQGCGMIRSTPADMMKFLLANLNLITDNSIPEIATTHEVLTDVKSWLTTLLRKQLKIGMGWFINKDGIVFHDGGTLGFSSFIGFHKEKQKGIFLLSNCCNPFVITPFALKLLSSNNE